MSRNREGPEVFRRAVPVPWQIAGGTLFTVLAVGALLAIFGRSEALGPLLAVQVLIVVIAAAGGGLFAGLAAALILVIVHVVLPIPGQFAHTAWFALFVIATATMAVLVGLLREDLGRIGSDLDTTRSLLDAANARIERSKEMEAMRAYYDPLTDLPSRRLVADRFGQIMPQARRTSTYAALLLLDLNKFKEVNQTFGRDIGDEVLRQVGLRLNTAMRRGDTVGRLDGNKFVVLLTALTERSGIDIAAQKLLNALADPIAVGRPVRELHVSASIGLAVFPDDGDDWEKLYQIADEALRVAKGKP